MKELYVGYIGNMCFVKPNNSRGRESVNKWLRSSNIKGVIIPNEEKTGYRITRLNTPKEYTITDSNGIAHNITSENLMLLISSCEIKHGLILDPLKYDENCRLLPKEAIENNKNDKKKIDKELYIPQHEIIEGSTYYTKSKKIFYYVGCKKLVNYYTNVSEKYYCYIIESNFNKYTLELTKTPKKFTDKCKDLFTTKIPHYLELENNLNLLLIEEGDNIQGIYANVNSKCKKNNFLYLYSSNNTNKLIKMSKSAPLHAQEIKFNKENKTFEYGEHLVVPSYTELINVSIFYNVLAKDAITSYNINITNFILST